ncbi:MAG: hypothetical protein KDD64_07145 [Bdellovibrionales bacterium]|nr:hypothetical protein [Bdellovibrionales bacterium]
MKYLFSFFIACSFLAGCSSSISDTGSEQAEIRPVDSLELYISRKSLTKTEFEQFKFADGQIYGECGTIVGGRYYPTLQDIRPSSSDSARAIASASDSVLDMAAAEDFHLDSPGKNTSLFDPGQFLLSLQRDGEAIRIETSLDSVSEPTSPLQRRLMVLAQVVRQTTRDALHEATLCGNTDFYGLPG